MQSNITIVIYSIFLAYPSTREGRIWPSDLEGWQPTFILAKVMNMYLDAKIVPQFSITFSFELMYIYADQIRTHSIQHAINISRYYYLIDLIPSVQPLFLPFGFHLTLRISP